jgi:hypothetical protein
MLASMPAEGAGGRLEALVALLDTAQRFAARLASDPLIARFLSVIDKLPAPDREPIVRILEREATWCRIVEQTAESTGITVRPNPHASLYVHVFERVDEPTSASRRDIDVIRNGMERLLYLVPLLFQEGVHEQWTASARELAREADPMLRAAVVRLAHEALGLVAEAEAADPGAGAANGVPASPPEAGSPRSARARSRRHGQ